MIHLKNSLVFFLQKTHSCHTYLYLFTEQTCLIQYDGHADVRRQQTGVHVNVSMFWRGCFPTIT